MPQMKHSNSLQALSNDRSHLLHDLPHINLPSGTSLAQRGSVRPQNTDQSFLIRLLTLQKSFFRSFSLPHDFFPSSFCFPKCVVPFTPAQDTFCTPFRNCPFICWPAENEGLAASSSCWQPLFCMLTCREQRSSYCSCWKPFFCCWFH